MVEPGVFQTELGNSAARPQHPVADYDAITDQLPGLYDWTPGNLAGAVRSIVGITAEDGAPLRLYLGHGLDEVRGHQKTRLEEWDRQQNLTESALQI
ncbi:hypothetical protein [Brevibacterium sp. VCM10]|uniref:hypothetical protein n=1 Tax=Brevibacterium sp. VCM10 TaxID=1381751 RepID=UPI001E45D269|nr:hypothetical protein [Brevibacterium sp. VCM10]